MHSCFHSFLSSFHAKPRSKTNLGGFTGLSLIRRRTVTYAGDKSTVPSTILSVDDERDVTDLISFHLTRAGFSVITASSGRAALESIAVRQPDLIILDLMLPDIDGFGICEILRRQAKTATIPIVILSAWATNDSRNLGLELGALEYVTKPFSPKKLVERVQHLLALRESA
jgi:two-component system alkaline phosphatase synthesis response regulator PhoP